MEPNNNSDGMGQHQEPWEVMPNVWKTRSEFFSWLRGVLRRGWNKHPAKTTLLNKSRFQIDNPSKKGKRRIWGLKCKKCGHIGPTKEFEVDHVIPAGSFRSWDDVGPFVHRLMGHCGEKDLRIVCKPCHGIYTYAERYGMTFEDATIEKRVIALKKLTIDDLKSKMGTIEIGEKPTKTNLLSLARGRLKDTGNIYR